MALGVPILKHFRVLSGETTLPFHFSSLLSKGQLLKERISFYNVGANSFFLESISFLKGFVMLSWKANRSERVNLGLTSHQQ